MIYFFVILFLLILILIYDIGGYRHGKQLMYIVILIILICISGFRFRIGSDTINYIREYSTYRSIDQINFKYLFSISGRQPGWVILVSLLKLFSPSFYLFQIVHAIFVNSIILSFLKRSTVYVFSSILAYFIMLYANLNFEVMRESIAIGFFLLSIPFYKSKSWLKFYTLALFALMFHESSVIIFFLPFIRNVKVNRPLFFMFLILMPIIFIFSQVLKDQISTLSVFNENIANKTTYYFNLEANSESVFSTSMIFNILISVILPLWVLYLNVKTKSTTYYDSIVVIALLIYVMSLAIPIFYRFNNYFIVFILLTFIKLFHSISIRFSSQKARNLVYVISLVSFLFIKSRIYFSSVENNTPNYVRFYPYYSIFDEKFDKTRETLFRAY